MGELILYGTALRSLPWFDHVPCVSTLGLLLRQASITLALLNSLVVDSAIQRFACKLALSGIL
jgi:hypothetical protein